ncbi:MAG: RNA polymerase sigma factor RpoD/SigA [bacterium]|nr:RNA polymerase sigma factor RpoD/SigA [bacterium]
MAGFNSQGNELLDLYFQDVSESEPLSSKEEILVAEQIHSGCEHARNRLVAANLRFVIKVACEYRGCGVPLEDLISAGNLGLITAAERFDPGRGFKFITYAVWWIRQAISQSLSHDSRMVRLPANRIKLLNNINDMIQRLGQAQAAEPDPEAIAEELGVSAELVRDTMVKARDVWYMDGAFSEGEDQDMLSVLPDTTHEAPDAQLEEASDREQVELVLGTLEDRESEVLRMHFGLTSGEPMTLEEIGNRFQLTKERVRQIKEKALSKLRHPTRRMHLTPLMESF